VLHGRSVRELSGAGPGRGARAVVPSITAVVPMLDEAENAGELLLALRDALAARSERFEIVVVNDGSRDAIRDVVLAAATCPPRRGAREAAPLLADCLRPGAGGAAARDEGPQEALLLEATSAARRTPSRDALPDRW